MKENRLILFFLVVSQFALSQIKGVVKDSISGEPIPYVNIWVDGENIGTTSEIDGSFVLDVKEEKVLISSALGYEIKKSSSKNEIILLKPKVFQLNEVVIERPKFQKEIEIGNFSKPESYHISGNLDWSNAKYFKYETRFEDTKFVKKIKIKTRSKVNNAKFKIRIFSVNKEGYPEKDILSEDIIVTVKKGKRKNVIDISNFKVDFPKEGLFIVYEVLKIETNKYIFQYTNEGSKKNTYHFRNGKWFKLQRWQNNETGDLKKFNNKVIEPAINLILTN
jgi:hypothetical protein